MSKSDAYMWLLGFKYGYRQGKHDLRLSIRNRWKTEAIRLFKAMDKKVFLDDKLRRRAQALRDAVQRAFVA